MLNENLSQRKTLVTFVVYVVGKILHPAQNATTLARVHAMPALETSPPLPGRRILLSFFLC